MIPLHAARSPHIRGVLSIAFLATLGGSVVAQIPSKRDVLYEYGESRPGDVQAAVTKGGWNAVWGRTVSEVDLEKAVTSLTRGELSGSFGDAIEKTTDTISAKHRIGRTAILDAVKRAIQRRGATIRVGRLGVKAGIATYHKWVRITHRLLKLPPTTRVLSSNYQPYVAFRLF